jgi:hypothetical protein
VSRPSKPRGGYNEEAKSSIARRYQTADYEVGYGRPPEHTQFPPGQSGNPAGRPKGLRNLITDVKSVLAAPVKVKESGHTRTRSTQEATLMVLRDKALRGDGRSIERLVELARLFNSAGDVGTSHQVVTADDQAMLDAYAADITTTATSQKSSVEPPLGPSDSLDKKAK